MPRRRQRIGRATLRRRTQLSHSRAAPRVRGGQRGERACVATGARGRQTGGVVSPRGALRRGPGVTAGRRGATQGRGRRRRHRSNEIL